MGSGRRMCPIQPILLAFVASSSLISLASGAPDAMEVMSAPNVLRAGTDEYVFVEIQDRVGNANVPVTIIVMNYPARTELKRVAVTLTKAENFQSRVKIMIPATHFSMDPKTKEYVYLQANFPNRQLQKIVLVNFQSGFIFIQTDKTLYTPESTVNFRVFGVNPGMEPAEAEPQTQIPTTVDIEIVNPADITIRSYMVSLQSGIYTGGFPIPKIVIVGQWKVVAKFHNNPQQSFTAEFEVKEYVLPSFEVKLKCLSPFFYVEDEELTIDIKAKYLFGEQVEGTAYAVFGVMHQNDKTGIPSSLKRVPIEGGAGEVTLERASMEETFESIDALEGKFIYIAVSVLTDSGSEMVEAELRGIPIVKSPYTISFKKTPTYFKPGVSFDVAVEVLNPDKTPAAGVPVVVTPGGDTRQTTAHGIVWLNINQEAINADGVIKPLTIVAKTNDTKISAERQTSVTLKSFPYQSPSKNYIHIEVDKDMLQLGTEMKFLLIFKQEDNEPNDITYLVMSRGQLVDHGQYKRAGQRTLKKTLKITKNMLPSFRLIVYYHIGSSEVVSDSVWLDVKDSCMGSLKLEVVEPENFYEPRAEVDLKVTGDPGATVGLVAVDKAVFVLNNKHRLTQKKIWRKVEESDIGCTAGGGENAMSVFHDAGLLFQSSVSSSASRTEIKCPAPRRSKRATTTVEVRNNFVSKYKTPEEKQCCVEGMNVIPLKLGYTCERRTKYITDDPPCAAAFLDCCKEMEKQIAEKKEENLQLARSYENDGYMDSNEISYRTKFDESWLWRNIKLPDCPKTDPNCLPTSFLLPRTPLQDTITTWQFIGIGLSKLYGICVADPLEVVVRKDFFIKLKMPYSAVRGEQVEIKAILHNYSRKRITVRVELEEDKKVCSAAYKRGKYDQEVTVGAQTTRPVPFVIIPMEGDSVPIAVKASVKGTFVGDGVRKMLRVVSPGVLLTSQKTVSIDPARKGVDGVQNENINSGIPPTNLAPGTATNTLVSVAGRENMNQLLKNAISGKTMGTLIEQPWGCGEQNIISMTLPIIATIFLDITKQWDTLDFEKRDEALKHIKTGYDSELAFRKPDGSFAAFLHYESSTWLTAYVARVFGMAYNLISLPKSQICDAVKFIIVRRQQPDGIFTESGKVYSPAMIDDVRGGESDASLTAFCLITLQATRPLCGVPVDRPAVQSLENGIKKAVTYLENRLPTLKKAYAVAVTSYALANENKLNLDILYKFAAQDGSHWPTYGLQTLEVTAYALLALVRAGEFEKAKPVVRWLNRQQRYAGTYGSTQATIMVYQAVAEYWANAKEPEYNLDVNILIPGRSMTTNYSFGKGNFAQRTSKFNGINKDIKVSANGTGEATVTVLSLYYALPQVKETHCTKFDMTLRSEEVSVAEDKKTYKLTIEVLFKDKERKSVMSILDIGLPTAFTYNRQDLDALSKGRARIIAKYESDTVLSERGSLIIYLDSVSNVETEVISFRIHQEMNVGFLQPTPVTVYEYNDKDRCTKFYHPDRESGELMKLCKGAACFCAEENCSMQRKENVDNNARYAKACETTTSGKIDFVYKARVEDFQRNLTTDYYRIRIVEAYKEGTTDVSPRGKVRIFLSHSHCKEALDLKPTKTYLIMGTSEDIRDPADPTSYVLGEKTWIEYWPTDAECQTDAHRATCLGMQKLIKVFRGFGCQAK